MKHRVSDAHSELERGKNRFCLKCGEISNRDRLVRFVCDGQNNLIPDIQGKLPGPGAWVHATRAAVQAAIDGEIFGRVFKSHPVIPVLMTGQVEALLKRRVLGLLRMARKAGHMYMGFDQVHMAVGMGRVGWRLEASDGLPGGRGKIRVFAKAVTYEKTLPLPPVLGCFSARELGTIALCSELVHGGIKEGGFSRALTVETSRLSGFCSLIPKNWPDKSHEMVQWASLGGGICAKEGEIELSDSQGRQNRHG